MGALAGFFPALQMALAQKQADDKQKDSWAKVLGLVSDLSKKDQSVKAANGLYDSNQDWQSRNPTKPDYSFNTPDLAASPVKTGLASLLPASMSGADTAAASPTSSFSLASLIPQSRQAAPTFDASSMWSSLGGLVNSGVDPRIAMTVLPPFFAQKQRERTAQPRQDGDNTVGDKIADPAGVAWYSQQFKAIKAAHPDASDGEIYQFLTKKIQGG